MTLFLKIQVDLYSSLREKGKQQDNWRARVTEQKTASSSASAEVCSAPWAGLSDSLHLRGTALPSVHTQPPCTLHQPPAQPQPSSTSRGWLQPRPRWSSQPCRSQSPWASLTPPWITTPSWRRWWCSARQGPPSSQPLHPKVQALALGSQENSMTTLLEVRAGDLPLLPLVFTAACKTELKMKSELLRKKVKRNKELYKIKYYLCFAVYY